MNEQQRFISRGFLRVALTLAIATMATVAGIQLWRHYVLSPWTRDGRVVANSVTVAAEVSGRIVSIRVAENQNVKKGEVLFTIDQATFKAALDNAKATVASTQATMEMRRSNAARGHKLTRLSISDEALQAIKQSGAMVHEIVLAPLGRADLHWRHVLPSWGCLPMHNHASDKW